MDLVESNLLMNWRDLWKYTRSHSGNNDRTEISLLDSSDKPDTNVPNIFADFFASVYNFQAANCTPYLPEGDISNLHSSIVVDKEIVRLCMKKLKPKLTAGHDGIPAALMKAYNDLFTTILCCF